jgi:hypothetical protein
MLCKSFYRYTRHFVIWIHNSYNSIFYEFIYCIAWWWLRENRNMLRSCTVDTNVEVSCLFDYYVDGSRSEMEHAAVATDTKQLRVKGLTASQSLEGLEQTVSNLTISGVDYRRFRNGLRDRKHLPRSNFHASSYIYNSSLLRAVRPVSWIMDQKLDWRYYKNQLLK